MLPPSSLDMLKRVQQLEKRTKSIERTLCDVELRAARLEIQAKAASIERTLQDVEARAARLEERLGPTKSTPAPRAPASPWPSPTLSHRSFTYDGDWR